MDEHLARGLIPQHDGACPFGSGSIYLAEKKQAAAEEEAEAIPRSEWDWICRAPACNRPWTEKVDEIKLCARCAAAFPDHPAEQEVTWK
jgi:hypothetical protein